MNPLIDEQFKAGVALIDGSRLITEACVRAGADVFIGYPITPANLLYLYAGKRFPIMLAAPDEITTLQWMCGYAVTDHMPVTATSFPGYALMLETINMAFMMELPMLVILVQRLGPATGTATTGAQGDIALLHGSISGGFSLPTFCISDFQDCWNVTSEAIRAAMHLRTPVVLLTSKEMVMTLSSFELALLPPIERHAVSRYHSDDEYRPYRTTENLVPDFLPVSNTAHQVRFTASTHDERGLIQSTSTEGMANTRRLQEKIDAQSDAFTIYEYDADADADVLLISFDVTAQAARDAIDELRSKGCAVSHLIPKTLFPIPRVYAELASKYRRVVVAEENLTGQYRHLLFGAHHDARVTGVNAIGRMISPEEIIREVRNG